MTKKIIKDAGLIIWHNSKLELVFHTSHSHFFFNLWKDIEVAIRRLMIRHPVFVVELGDHNLILINFF